MKCVHRLLPHNFPLVVLTPDEIIPLPPPAPHHDVHGDEDVEEGGGEGDEAEEAEEGERVHHQLAAL